MSVTDYQFSSYAKGFDPTPTHRAELNPDRYVVSLDAPAGFVIRYRSVPTVAISFWSEGPDSLLVYQIQGVNKKLIDGRVKTRPGARGLFYFDHGQVAIDLVRCVALTCGFSRVGVRSANNNPCTQRTESDQPHVPLSRAMRIYDTAAQIAGMNRCNADGNLYLELE